MRRYDTNMGQRMILAFLALLLVATVALWIRSLYWSDSVGVCSESHRYLAITTLPQRIFIGTWYDPVPVRGFHADSDAASEVAIPPEASQFAGFFCVRFKPMGWGIGVPFWVFPPIELAAFMWVLVRWRKPFNLNLCPHCGYDLRATPERCPECGTIVKGAGSASTNAKTIRPLPYIEYMNREESWAVEGVTLTVLRHSADAYHITSPEINGAGAASAMRLALEDAGLNREDIGYINAHGTSTELGDLAETKGIHAVFGAHANRLMVSSTKSQVGHLLGAAGALSVVVVALSLDQHLIPATMNLDKPGEGCDLDYVPNKARERRFNYVMSNSFGFGGHNASIVLGRA